jgi:hypothetical protein
MATSTIWISFDLGVRGDYESMYEWLDSYDAKECSSNLAVLSYEYTGRLLDSLKSELKKTIAIDRRTRIYIIHWNALEKKIKGSFLFGTRKAPPWTGYADGDEETEDES